MISKEKKQAIIAEYGRTEGHYIIIKIYMIWHCPCRKRHCII